METTKTQRAFEARQKIVHELRALDADIEGRSDATEGAEDIAKRERLETDLRSADQAMEAAIEADAKDVRFHEAYAAAGFSPEAPAADHRSEELRSIEAFARGDLKTLELRAALQKSNTGANAVDDTLYAQIIKSLTDYSTVVRANARILTTASGEQVNWPKRLTIPTAALVAEGGTYGKSDGTFGTVALNAYKYGFISQVSEELLTDAAFNVAAEVASMGGEAIGVGLGSAFIAGDGVNKPEGVLEHAVTNTFAATAAVTTDELIDVVHSITQPYRAGAGFIMNDATVAAVRKLKGSDGQYIWQPSSQAGTPDSLLGYPVFADSGMPTMTNSAKSVVFGDLAKGFIVRLVGNVEVTRSDEYAFDAGLVSWKFSVRADSGIVDDNAIAVWDQAAV